MGSGDGASADISFERRRQALQARVNDVAKALFEQGVRPTVSRVRAALGGGSPNDLAPAVKHWKETVLPALPAYRGGGQGKPALPLQVADLVQELWQRAMAAALVEVRGGPTAREVAARTAEAQGLRQQMTALRDQLQRESLAYGELRAQAARHEAIAREALARAHDGELRERELLREMGGLRERVAELEAGLGQRALARASRGGALKGGRVKSAGRKVGETRKVQDIREGKHGVRSMDTRRIRGGRPEGIGPGSSGVRRRPKR